MVTQTEVDNLRQQIADKEVEFKKQVARMLAHDAAAECASAAKSPAADVPLEEQVEYLRKKLEATEEARKKHLAKMLATQAMFKDVDHLKTVLLHKEATKRSIANGEESPIPRMIDPPKLQEEIDSLRTTLDERQRDTRRQQAKDLAKEAQAHQPGHKTHDWDVETAAIEKQLAEKEDALRREKARALAKEALGVGHLVRSGIHVDPNAGGTPQKPKPVTQEEIDDLKLVLEEKEDELKRKMARMLACEAVVANAAAKPEVPVNVNLEEHVDVLRRKLDDKEEAHKKHLAKVLATEAVFKEVEHLRTVVSHKEDLLKTQLSLDPAATPQTRALGQEVCELKAFMLDREMGARRMEARNLAKEAQAEAGAGVKKHDTEAELAAAKEQLDEKEAELKRRQARAFALEAVKAPPVLHHVSQKPAAPKEVKPPTYHDVEDTRLDLAHKEREFKKHIAQLLANEAAAAYEKAHPGEGSASLEVQVDTLRKQVADAEEQQKRQLAKALATEALFREVDHLRSVVDAKEQDQKKHIARAMALAAMGMSPSDPLAGNLEKEVSGLKAALADVEGAARKQQAKDLAKQAQGATNAGVKQHDRAAEVDALRAELAAKEDQLKRQQARALAQSALSGKAAPNGAPANGKVMSPEELDGIVKQETKAIHDLESVLSAQEQAFKKHMAKVLAFECRARSKDAPAPTLQEEVARLQGQLDEAEDREKRHLAKMLATEAIFADLTHLRKVAEKKETDAKKQDARALAMAVVNRSADAPLCSDAQRAEVEALHKVVEEREQDCKRAQAKEVANQIAGKTDTRDYHGETETLRKQLEAKEEELKREQAKGIAAAAARMNK